MGQDRRSRTRLGGDTSLEADAALVARGWGTVQDVLTSRGIEWLEPEKAHN
jgi:hypothetical protein